MRKSLTAAVAIAIGVFANTGMKLVLALMFGSTGYRLVAGGGLAAMLIALGVSLGLMS